MRTLPLTILAAVTLFTLPAAADDAAVESGTDAASEPSHPICGPDGTTSIASDGTSVSCAPYLCSPSSGMCAVSCASSADCVAGKVCDSAAGRCTGVSECTPDGKSAIAKDGTVSNCAPYTCSGGMCRMACATNADCQAPTFCSTKSAACVVTENPQASPDQSDGCAYGGRGAPAFGFAMLGLALAARARRKNG